MEVYHDRQSVLKERNWEQMDSLGFVMELKREAKDEGGHLRGRLSDHPHSTTPWLLSY